MTKNTEQSKKYITSNIIDIYTQYYNKIVVKTWDI